MSSTQMLEDVEVEVEVEEVDLEAMVEIRIGSKLKKTSPMEEDMVTLEKGVLLFLCTRILLAFTTKKRKAIFSLHLCMYSPIVYVRKLQMRLLPSLPQSSHGIRAWFVVSSSRKQIKLMVS